MRRFREISRRLRRDQTSAEARLWRELRAYRFEHRKFRRQHQIGRYIVDFVCLDAKLVIEVDGDTHGSETEMVLDAIWMELHHRTTL